MSIDIIKVRNVTTHPEQDNELNMEVLFAHLPAFVPFTARRTTPTIILLRKATPMWLQAVIRILVPMYLLQTYLPPRQATVKQLLALLYVPHLVGNTALLQLAFLGHGGAWVT